MESIAEGKGIRLEWSQGQLLLWLALGRGLGRKIAEGKNENKTGKGSEKLKLQSNESDFGNSRSAKF